MMPIQRKGLSEILTNSDRRMKKNKPARPPSECFKFRSPAVNLTLNACVQSKGFSLSLIS